LRVPTKARLGINQSECHAFVEPILPVAVMIHHGKLREQHEAFVNVVTKFIVNKTEVFKSIKEVLVTDHEFSNIWPEATTIFCKNHLERNIKEFLRKNKLGNKSEIQPVITEFYKMLNSTTEPNFMQRKCSLTESEGWSGAMRQEKVRNYLLTNIVPKIESNAGRYICCFITKFLFQSFIFYYSTLN